MRYPALLSLFATAALLEACGGTSNDGGGGTCSPGMTAAISITAAGVTPKAVCVLPAGTVTFTNNDTVQHSVQDSGTACPQLNLAAIPASGGTATTAAFPTAMVCQFHDQAAPTDTKFQGTVGVTTGPQPGY